ncbi:uncharacterized protein [Triticum aestivum]|uniref:uncharacterized protein isoform X2 n=1 Tax=Triticum aestivum TaxID=4565 RepID=UPI001D031FEF|nr:uncharacterized protein LOC123156876 isoform X2 [Triticum aestivum]
MHPELKAYLDEFRAKAQARYDATDRLFAQYDALLSMVTTGASVPQSARSAVAASDGGLAVDATVMPVVSAPSSTSKAQEVLELVPDASPACIARAPVLCSTDGSNQVLEGVSTLQPACPMAMADDDGLTDNARAPAVVAGVFSATTQAQETPTVAHDAASVCIAMAPITCSMDYSTQVDAITSVDEVQDAVTTVYP